LSAECPTDAIITPGVGPFEPGDVLTCNANGYNPSYTWTGTNNGDIGSQTGSTYTLQEGDFDVTCTATIGELTCTATASDSVTGTAVGKYELQHNTLVTILMLVTLSVSYLNYFTASNCLFGNTGSD